MSTFTQVIAEDDPFTKFSTEQYFPTLTLVTSGTVTIKGSRGISLESILSVESSLVPRLLVDEELDRINIDPKSQTEEYQDDFGIPELTGSKQYLVKNHLDAEYTSLNLANNFDINSYNYLLFKDLKSINSSLEVTLKISLGKTSGANISDSSETWNRTIIDSAVFPTRYSTWNNLLLETNSTFQHCINIELVNADIRGYYIFQLEDNRLFSDCRYASIYINNLHTPVSKSLSDYHRISSSTHYLRPETAGSYAIPQSTQVSELNISKILSVPSSLEQQSNVKVQAVGWLSASDLEDDLKESWREQLVKDGQMSETDEILTYNITNSFVHYSVNNLLSWRIRRELKEQLAISDDYRLLVRNALNAILPFVYISNTKDPFSTIKALKLLIGGTDHPYALLDAGLGGESAFAGLAAEGVEEYSFEFAEDEAGDIFLDLDGLPDDYDPASDPGITPPPYNPLTLTDENGEIDNTLVSTVGVIHSLLQNKIVIYSSVAVVILLGTAILFWRLRR